MYLFVFYIRRNQTILICYRIFVSVTAMDGGEYKKKKKNSSWNEGSNKNKSILKKHVYINKILIQRTKMTIN